MASNPNPEGKPEEKPEGNPMDKGLEDYKERFTQYVHHLFNNREFTDVQIICENDELIYSHKLLLNFASGFFQSYFRTAPKCLINNNDLSIVELKQFKASDLNLLLNWIYSGEAPPDDVLDSKLFTILTMANYLLIDILKQKCYDHLVKLIETRIETDPSIAMEVHELGESLADATIVNMAKEAFLKIRFLPDDFLSLSPNAMEFFLNAFDQCSLRTPFLMNGICREMYLVDLVVSYINHDKKNRLKHAERLFLCLKLGLVAKKLHFNKLGLKELTNELFCPQLSKKIQEYKKLSGDFDLWSLPETKDWTPRPGSIRYSMWTSSRGNFRVELSKIKKRTTLANEVWYSGSHQGVDINGNHSYLKSLVKTNQTPSCKRFKFDKEQSAHIVRIDVSSSPWRNWKTNIVGIKFYWSDNTVSEAGDLDCKIDSVILEPGEVVTAAISADLFVRSIMFYSWFPTSPVKQSDMKKHGPFGDMYAPTVKEVVSLHKNIEDRLFIDGLRGHEVTIDNRKSICGLGFKMTMGLNFSLKPFFTEYKSASKGDKVESPAKVSLGKQKLTPDFLKKPYHQMKMGEFRYATRNPRWRCSLWELTPDSPESTDA